MKKTYQNPEMRVVQLNTSQMLLTVSGFEQNLGGEGGDGSGALSPSFFGSWEYDVSE